MESVRPPKIIFILADDHAGKSISCNGAGINKTPNLDRIANGGMRFDHCYVTNAYARPPAPPSSVAPTTTSTGS
ncbi:hypothetical protein ACJ41O_005021 [Fusarium nematophilum]